MLSGWIWKLQTTYEHGNRVKAHLVLELLGDILALGDGHAGGEALVDGLQEGLAKRLVVDKPLDAQQVEDPEQEQVDVERTPIFFFCYILFKLASCAP